MQKDGGVFYGSEAIGLFDKPVRKISLSGF